MLDGPGFTKIGGTNRECTLGQQEWAGPAAGSGFGRSGGGGSRPCPGTLPSASVANIKAAMNRLFIPDSFYLFRFTNEPSRSL